MKKVILIVLCFLCLGLVRSNAQAISTNDSIRQVQLQKKQDSIAAVVKKRQQERLAKQDSLRRAKKASRDLLREQNKKFVNRKKERERIRDSIAKESKRAAAARKAYKKKLKKKGATKVKEKKKQPKKARTNKKKQSNKPQKGAQPKKKEIKTKTKKKTTKPAAKKKVKNKRKNKKKDLGEFPLQNKKKKKVKRKKANAPQKNKVVKPQVKKKKIKNNKRKKKSKKQERTTETLKTKKTTTKEKKAQSLKEKVIKNKAKRPAKNNLYSTSNSYKKSNFFKRQLVKLPPEKKRTLFSFQFGPSFYIGDLGGDSKIDNYRYGNINFKEDTYFYGFSLTHLRREAIGLRLSYVFGKIAGSDKNTYFTSISDPAYDRFVRNLDFQTTISEGSLILELHPFKFLSHKTRLHHSYLQPYALIGVGRYSFNPQGSYFDPILDDIAWVDLQPLSTEGQGFAEYPDRKSYELTQWNIPYGFGFNYEISPSLQLGVEVVGRKLFTDHLDDVSTNFIDPNLYDEYLIGENIELAKILNNKSKLIDAERAYKPGNQRGNSNNNDLFFSVSGRLIIKINRNKTKQVRKILPGELFKYDDNEICE